MQLDLDKIIEKLRAIEVRFNEAQSTTKRYALIQALNHIAENELPIHGYWEDTYRKAMVKNAETKAVLKAAKGKGR